MPYHHCVASFTSSPPRWPLPLLCVPEAAGARGDRPRSASSEAPPAGPVRLQSGSALAADVTGPQCAIAAAGRRTIHAAWEGSGASAAAARPVNSDTGTERTAAARLGGTGSRKCAGWGGWKWAFTASGQIRSVRKETVFQHSVSIFDLLSLLLITWVLFSFCWMTISNSGYMKLKKCLRVIAVITKAQWAVGCEIISNMRKGDWHYYCCNCGWKDKVHRVKLCILVKKYQKNEWREAFGLRHNQIGTVWTWQWQVW